MKPKNNVVRHSLKGLAVLLVATAAMLQDSPPVKAGNGGAFVGGLVAGHIVGGFVRRDKARTQAEMDRTYRAPPPPQAAPVSAPAAPPPQSVEQRLADLDDLARKGYINKDEYQTRRKAILDSM